MFPLLLLFWTSLVFARSLTPITKRSLVTDFAPKDSVVLRYGEGNPPFPSPTPGTVLMGLDYSDQPVLYHADLTLHSHPGRRILPLESVNALIACDATGVLLRFHSASDAAAALDVWAPEMVVVTSHAGCGEVPGDRAVFMFAPLSPSLRGNRVINGGRVTGVVAQTAVLVKLFTVPTTWRTAARRMSVALDHVKREEEGEDGEMKEGTLSLTTAVPERVLLYPLVDSTSSEEDSKDKDAGERCGPPPGVELLR
jgi:hypothetical protein